MEIQELDVLRAQLAKNTGCVGAGHQGDEPPMQELEKRELLILSGIGGCKRAVKSGSSWPGRVRKARENGMSCVRFRSPLPTRNNGWLLPRVACD